MWIGMRATDSLDQTHTCQIFPSPETHSWFSFGFMSFSLKVSPILLQLLLIL